jgi:hypothetical protein
MHGPTVSQYTSPLTHYWSRYIGTFDYTVLRPVPFILSDRGTMSLGDEHYANDGTVPLFSQWHPYECSATRCWHPGSEEFAPPRNSFQSAGTDKSEGIVLPKPGLWHVHAVQGVGHSDMVPVWVGSQQQRAFWREMGIWLRVVDASHKVLLDRT